MRTARSRIHPPQWVALLAAAMIVLASVSAPNARSAELVPSIGITRNVHGNDGAKLSTGLALRDALAPAVMGEIAVAYHNDDRFGDQLHVRTWPVTASLYLTPVPAVYAGAGVGWYHTTLDYANNLPGLADQTHQDFGVHVGGGLRLPLGPAVGLDLSGRYVMLRPQESRLVPEKFDPDYWTTSLGLSIKL